MEAVIQRNLCFVFFIFARNNLHSGLFGVSAEASAYLQVMCLMLVSEIATCLQVPLKLLNIIFGGPQDVAYAYRQANVLVHPSS
jgi:hypothetical protein